MIMVKSKLKKSWKKKSKFPGHVIDHALCCLQIETNDAYLLLNVPE